MENKKHVGAASSSSSSSSSSLDHLFGPRGSSASSSSSSSSATGSFSSMFQHPQPAHQAARYGNPGNGSRGLANQETAEPSYLSSSIYYGGQENYSPRKNTETHHNFKKDGKDDPNEGSSSGASRGNWWEGSLYY